MAEVTGRRLGREVTLHETGFKPRDTVAPVLPPPSPGIDDFAARLVELGAADADPSRRVALRALVYSLAALPAGGGPAAASIVGPESSDRSPRAAAVHAMAGLFSRADSLLGGSHIRPALIAYLAGDVVHWLRAPGPSAARRELAGAAAELGYLAAFVSFDSGLHGLAQRYYLSALDLAEYAGDLGLRATVLRGMSV